MSLAGAHRSRALNACAQGATPMPLAKAIVSDEVAARTLMKMQINADRRASAGRRVPRVRADAAGRPGHLRDLRAVADRRHRRRARHGRRVPDRRRDRPDEGARPRSTRARPRASWPRASRRSTAGRSAWTSARSRACRTTSSAAACRSSSRTADRRDRRRRRQHGRAVRLHRAHQGARTAAARFRPPIRRQLAAPRPRAAAAAVAQAAAVGRPRPLAASAAVDAESSVVSVRLSAGPGCR